MWFFKNRFNSNNTKLEIIQKIEDVQSRLTAAGVSRVVLKLDDAISVLDNKFFQLNQEQAKLINSCLDAINAHATKSYETFALKKCEHISSVLRGEVSGDEHTMTELRNEEKLYEMQNTLNDIEKQISVVERKMDEALGKDKTLWNMLNSERTRLKNRSLVISKNYKTLLENQQTLAVAKDVQEARFEAEEIMRQNTLDTVAGFEDNVEYTTLAAEDARENNEKVQSVFSKAFGQSDDDAYEYERALEKKLAETKLSASAPVGATAKVNG